MATGGLTPLPDALGARVVALGQHLDAGGRLWLVSDVHANWLALRAWFSEVATDDAVIFMGDLLTYGCHPNQTLELVERCLSTHTSALLVGNHDVLYRDLLEGDTRYYDKLPAWIRESVDWTLERIDARWFSDGLPWVEEAALGKLLVAHANPYGHRDWSYLDGVADYQRAARVLAGRGFQLGVFGHVHRPRLLAQSVQGEHWDTALIAGFEVHDAMTAVWNVGSIGQQRAQHCSASVGVLRQRGSSFELRHDAISYDWGEHVESINNAGLSATTTERLISFHAAAPAAPARGERS